MKIENELILANSIFLQGHPHLINP